MQRSCQTLALLLTLLTFAAASHAKDDGHDKDRAAITADYILVDTAWENKDADGATAFLTDDWSEIETDGTKSVASKKEQRDTMSKVLAYAIKVTSHTVITNIVFTKEGALETHMLNINITVSVGGKTITGGNTSTESDTWIKSGDTWLIKQTKVLVDRSTTDGKPDK